MFHIMHVVGTRPNFIKIAPIMDAVTSLGCVTQTLVHTGQHYDKEMSTQFFEELQIYHPDIDLGVGSESHAVQVAQIMIAFERVVIAAKPDAILLVGDVNSTIACAMVAAKLNVPTIHVEAGIRSFDRTMPEEINRLVTDTISTWLLPPSQDAVENLIKEGRDEASIKLVGNVMIDTLFRSSHRINHSDIVSSLSIAPNNYATITMHRPSNVDQSDTLESIIASIDYIQQHLPVVFPIHPRTQNALNRFSLTSHLKALPNLIITPPLGYFDFGRLIKDSLVVLTDSGGIQEETTVYGIPCITLRTNTERPITVSQGTSVLAGNNTRVINRLFDDALTGRWKTHSIPYLWDGKSANRIAEVIEMLCG